MDILRTILIIRYIPVLVIGGFFLLNALLFVAAGTGIFILQGVDRVQHGQSFLPPEPHRKPQKPTGLSIFMHNAFTSPAGRNAARKHLLIPDPAYSPKARHHETPGEHPVPAQ
jgi:hypothetical protein